MRKVNLIDEDGCKTCMIEGIETPNKILKHFFVDTKTKIIYLNGSILSKEKMDSPIPGTGTVFLAVRDKTVMW